MVKPFSPHSSIKAPAVRGPPGFLKTEPAHGWSNGVPALRHRSSRACNSLSLAGGSSMSASFASTTITLPRFEDRYLNEICLRRTCRIFPLASITVASVSTSANSAPCAPAFMYTPPPTVPGIPMKRSTPAKPASAVRRARSGVGRPAPTMAVAPFISKRSRPFPMRITTPGKPASLTSTFEPRPSATHGSPLFDGRSFVLCLETPHAAGSAAQSDDRIAGGARGRHRRRVRHAVHQRRPPDRVIVRLRELPEGRIDQQLDFARHDQIDRVGPPFVHFGHPLGRHTAGPQVPRGALGGRESKPQLVEPPRDRQHGRFVRVVHRHEDPPRQRQAAVGGDLRLGKSHPEAVRQPHHLAGGPHLPAQDGK